jgi:hypothetical protein
MEKGRGRIEHCNARNKLSMQRDEPSSKASLANTAPEGPYGSMSNEMAVEMLLAHKGFGAAQIWADIWG